MAAAKADPAPLLPVYLFVGEDRLKRDALLSRMEERIGKLGDISLNETVFNGSDIDAPDEVAAACATFPFLSEKRLVVVKEIDRASKAVQESICAYLESPSETTVLVMVGDKLAKNTRLYKAISKIDPKAVIACDLKTRRNEVRDFAVKLAASLGMGLDQRAAEELIDRVGKSTVAMDTEIKKLAAYARSQGRDSISPADVAELVAKPEPPKPWDMVDAMASRDMPRCLKILSEADEQFPFGALRMCVQRIEELITVKALRTRPGSQSLANVLGGPDWKYKKHAEQASRFSEAELLRALSEAAECELRMKTGSDRQISFEIWLAGVCTGSWPSPEF